MYGRAASHEFWPNRRIEVGSSLPPPSQHTSPSFGRFGPIVGPAGHLLAPLDRGLVPRGLPGQWTPMVTRPMVIFPFNSLEKL
jgi:hypothetical protein